MTPTTPGAVLALRQVELDGQLVDVRIEGGRVSAIQPHSPTTSQVTRTTDLVVEGSGGALIPGLHDHHIHLLAWAAALRSTQAGPPTVTDRSSLGATLRRADAELPDGEWLRAVGYHESVGGDLDRHALDPLVPRRPLRVQHRSGGLWVLNSAGLAAVGIEGGREAGGRRGQGHRGNRHPEDLNDPATEGIERDEHGQPTGRLFRMDGWLAGRLPRQAPDLGPIGLQLARHGVTGVTDATPFEQAHQLAPLARAVAEGVLPQRVVATGGPELAATDAPRLVTTDGPDLDITGGSHPGAGTAATTTSANGCPAAGQPLAWGPVKLLLPDHEPPPLDTVVEWMQAARSQGRPVAVHCVTRLALVLTLTAFEEVGTVPGDRIEHGAVIPVELLDRVREMELTVVTQPGFIRTRGDHHLSDVEPHDRDHLWRCGSLLAAGVPVGGSTDAPFGDPDPWAAMEAAIERRTIGGATLGPAERIPARRALDLFLAPLDDPGGPPRRVTVNAPADFCLLAEPLGTALHRPSQAAVAATIISGRLYQW